MDVQRNGNPDGDNGWPSYHRLGARVSKGWHGKNEREDPTGTPSNVVLLLLCERNVSARQSLATIN